MQREIRECSDLRVTFGLSDKARAHQNSAIARAYEQAVKARDEVLELIDRGYKPIISGLTACGGYAGRDFKLIVGSALLELTVAEGGRPSLDIIVVKTNHGEGHGYCVLVTEAGAERIVAVAHKMTFEAAERARASKPPKGAEADAAKHGLDALAELGLTNVLGLALPDTRKLTSEQVEAVLAATCGIRKATVEGGDGLWVAINTLAQAVEAAAPPSSLAMGTPPSPPQLVGTPAPPALAGPGDASDAETEVGGTQGIEPSDGGTALPLMPVSPRQPSGGSSAPEAAAPAGSGVGGPQPMEVQAPAAAELPPPTSVRQADGRVVSSVLFGPGTSRYYKSYLTPKLEQALLKWCRYDVRFQIFNCTSQQRVKGGEPRLKAPKAEYYRLDERGRRPHYKWTQLNDFDHAGEVMPPLLEELCEQLNADFGLEGDNRFNHCLIICNEQSGSDKDAHCAPPHADKIQKGFFVDVSLGYPREFRLIDAKSEEVVASQKLASGSLAYITAHDNGRLVQGCKRAKGEPKVQGTRYLHAVPVDADQPRDQPRFSLVFRPITDHPKGAKCGEHIAEVDETKAASVRPGGDLWREYVPLCRGGNGAAPAPEATEVVAPEAAAPATTRAGRKRKAGTASGGGEGDGGDSGGGGSVSGEAGGDGDGGARRAAPTAQAPTATAKVRRTRGAASADQPAVAAEAQADAPAQAPPLAASPPTPEEATQQLREALVSSDEAAAALALEALEGVVKTKDTLHNTSAMRLPNTHANTRAPPPRHLVPNRRGQGRQRAPPQQGHAGGAALARQGAVGEVEGARVTRVCAPSRWGARGSSITAMTRTRRPRSGRGCYSRTGWTPSSAPEAALEEDWSRGVYGEGERGRKLPNRK